jgi:hypothetical protein
MRAAYRGADTDVTELTWLGEWSVPAVGEALSRTVPALTGSELAPRPAAPRPDAAGGHVRGYLGDALWRGEAGLPLPVGGTPAGYADLLAAPALGAGAGPGLQ